MDEFSILIGGKAGFGIDKSGAIISYMANSLGYNIYVYRDYPSIIRGGHTFSIVRASVRRISAHRDKIDYLLALNQDTVQMHSSRLKKNSIIVYDADTVKCEDACPVKNAVGIPISKILKEEAAPEIMRNTCAIAAFAKTIGIGWEVVEKVLKKQIQKDIEMNLKVAKRGYDYAKNLLLIKPADKKPEPLITGNEAIGLGLIRGGLRSYIAYPMTPSSPILHFLANAASDFNLKVIHPESEISVILMALGFSYCQEPVAVGTSGGGFCLMTEGLSLSGMAELPVVIVLGQRPGPSTGLPTYTSQTELHFAIHAGQGEFPRFITAPGDAMEGYFWSAVSMDISKKFQVPSIILADKTMEEGTYSFDINCIDKIGIEEADIFNVELPYKRYRVTDTGVSPLSRIPDKVAIVKVNSYEHDEYGLTTEESDITKIMQDKRLRKSDFIAKEIEKYETVNIYGNSKSSDVLLCWGSNKGVCLEVAERLNLKVVQPVVLSPFPGKRLRKALEGAKNILSVENNATGQLGLLLKSNGFEINNQVLKYDGRPFSVDELEERIKALSYKP